MLNIITGPARSGKSESILCQIKALAAAEKRSVLIVPESYSHQAERRMLELCGNPGGRWASVTTFSKLCRDILREGGLHPRSLDAAGRVLYMYSALARCQTALKYYKGAAKPQMISRLLETVDELTACRISPEQLIKAAEQDGLSAKICDLAVIYSAFQAEITDGGLDPRDPFDLACALIGKSGVFCGAHVFIDGFNGFTAQRREAITQILQRAESLSVALLLDERDEVLFTRQSKTRGYLLQMAERAGVKVRHIRCCDRENTPLSRLARGAFFHGEPPVEMPAGALELYSCSTPHEECELAAALARQLVICSNVRARQIAVVCPDTGGYGHMLENAFERYGVPVFVSAPEDVLAKPPVIAALGALYAVQSGLTADSVLDWLKSGLAGVTPGQCDTLENYARIWNIRGNRWLAPFELLTTGYGPPAKDEQKRLARLNRIREAAAAPLEELRRDLRTCVTGGDFAQALQAHLARTRFEQRLARRVRLLASREPRLAGQYSQLFGAINSAIEQFAGALGSRQMDLNDFTRLIRLALGQYEVDVIPVSLDAAQVCSSDRLPMGGAEHVFILGASEGSLPAATSGAGLLTESERVTLETSGIVLTQTAEDMAFEEQSNIYRALACGERLVITAPQTGHDGAELRPSYVAERIKKLSGIDEKAAREQLARLSLAASVPAFESACRAVNGGDALACAARRHFECDAQRKATLDGLLGWTRVPRPDMSRPELIEELYGGQISMTASRIEQVASCRFSYFMRYGLKASPRKGASFGAPEIGSFVHEVVECSVRDICSGLNQDISGVVQSRIEETAAHFFKNKEATHRMRGIFALLCENIVSIVQNIWQEIECSEFKPLFFELDFSANGDMPALDLTAAGAHALIRGKIDRVDGWLDGQTLYLKVVDYKTGRKSFRLSDVYYGLNLQMFIYLLMLERVDRRALLSAAAVSLGGEAIETGIGGALYIPAKAPWIAAAPDTTPDEIRQASEKELRRVGIVSSEPHVLAALEKIDARGPRFLPVGIKRDGSLSAASSAASARQLDLLIHRAEELVAQLTYEISRGSVDANPYRVGRDFTVCQWCDYAQACHFDPRTAADRYRNMRPMKDAEVFEKLANDAGAAETEGR